MARIKIALPAAFSFSCKIAVRITDINYGGHVGNDGFLAIVHEARMQFLKNLDYTEMNFGGAGMIMTDAAIEFKGELFYGDTVIVSVGIADISGIGFDLVYKLEKETATTPVVVAFVKTGMVCYDYAKKKVVAIPDEALKLMIPKE
jgi:acyl-CoA thioester hydrolase